ncbi:MAG: chemotaxis protein CheC [Peptococcaceae bacterium]|jgi:chemotaxis protein CheC|nr:chemotaxis protein CheC [Peptococcaceae bacterium]
MERQLKHLEDLNDLHMDVLREIGNIGSGNAASALSTMLDRPVDISVPRVRILDYNEVTESLGGPEELLVGLLLSLSGDVTGMMMFLLHKDFAHMVISTLTGEEMPNMGDLDEFSSSAIQEVGNIMAASYVNAIASLTSLTIDISPPDLCVDMVGAILSVPAIYFGNIGDKIIFIEDELDKSDDRKSSHILMIPEMDSLAKIMANLGLESI